MEEALNELLEAEAEKLTQAARYERSEQRQGLPQRALQLKPHNHFRRRNAESTASQGCYL